MRLELPTNDVKERGGTMSKNAVVCVRSKIVLEDIYCLPIAALKLFMLDFEKGENLGRLKKKNVEMKFEIELTSNIPEAGFRAESKIAHDVWEQYDVLVDLFDSVHERLMEFCRLYENKDFIPYSFVLRKKSVIDNELDDLISINTAEYIETKMASINIPSKKSIEKEINRLLAGHELNTVVRR